MPPIDIAWVWHLHRLAPLKYAAYCRERFGAVLDLAPLLFVCRPNATKPAPTPKTARARGRRGPRHTPRSLSSGRKVALPWTGEKPASPSR